MILDKGNKTSSSKMLILNDFSLQLTSSSYSSKATVVFLSRRIRSILVSEKNGTSIRARPNLGVSANGQENLQARFLKLQFYILYINVVRQLFIQRDRKPISQETSSRRTCAHLLYKTLLQYTCSDPGPEWSTPFERNVSYRCYLLLRSKARGSLWPGH